MAIDSVLLVTPRLLRNGGVGAHVHASAEALARAGVRVGVLTAASQPDADPVGVSVIHSPRIFESEGDVKLAMGDARAFAPNVIHLHEVYDPNLLADLQTSAPVLASVHGYPACTSGVHYFRPGEECTRAHGPGCVPNLLGRGCAHTRRPQRLPAGYWRASRAVAMLCQADLAISYSSVVDRHLSANGVARRRVIPYFPTMAPSGHSRPPMHRRVLFAGRIVAPKGVAVLIRAAAAVDGEFVICGDGWKLESMRKLAGRLGVAERVHFTGWLGAEEIAQQLADASVLALPSLWPEPFGLVGIEAMAAGRPVVASATGGIGDWLEHGVNGLSVAPGNHHELARALEELLGDPQMQGAMGEAGREMVNERFSPDAHVAALTNAYALARAHWETTRVSASRGASAPDRLLDQR